MDSPLVYALGATVIAVVAWWFMARFKVPQGNEATLERSGRYVRTLPAGTHVIAWPLERIGVMQDIREQKLDLTTLSALTRDQMRVQLKLLALYQVINSAKASYEVANLKAALSEVIGAQVTAAVAGYTLDELNAERERLALMLPARLDAVTEAWGVKVTRLDLVELGLPNDLIEAIMKRRQAEEEQKTLRVAMQSEKIRVSEEAERERAAERAAIELARERALKEEELARLAAEAQQQQTLIDKDLKATAMQLQRAQASEELEIERLRIEQREQAALAAQASDARVLEARRAYVQQELEIARIAAEHARLEAQKEQDAMRLKGEVAIEEMRQTEALEQERRRQALQQEQSRLEHERAQQNLLLAHEQERLAQQSAVERAQHESQRQRLEQEIRLRQMVAESLRDQAHAAAVAREEAAMADVRAAKILADALGDRSPQFLAYLAAREYVDALRQMAASGQRSPVLSAATAFADGTTPLAELARQAERLATQVAGQLGDHADGEKDASGSST